MGLKPHMFQLDVGQNFEGCEKHHNQIPDSAHRLEDIEVFFVKVDGLGSQSVVQTIAHGCIDCLSLWQRNEEVIF